MITRSRLSLLAVTLFTVSVEGQAYCTSVTDEWLSHPSGKDPCAVYNIIAGNCGFAKLNLLGSGQQYPALTSGTATDCSCAVATYELMAACSYCQGRGFISIDTYKGVCATAPAHLSGSVTGGALPSFSEQYGPGNNIEDIGGGGYWSSQAAYYLAIGAGASPTGQAVVKTTTTTTQEIVAPTQQKTTDNNPPAATTNNQPAATTNNNPAATTNNNPAATTTTQAAAQNPAATTAGNASAGGGGAGGSSSSAPAGVTSSSSSASIAGTSSSASGNQTTSAPTSSSSASQSSSSLSSSTTLAGFGSTVGGSLNPTTKHGLSSGTKVGIAVGAVIIILLVVLFLIFKFSHAFRQFFSRKPSAPISTTTPFSLNKDPSIGGSSVEEEVATSAALTENGGTVTIPVLMSGEETEGRTTREREVEKEVEKEKDIVMARDDSEKDMVMARERQEMIMARERQEMIMAREREGGVMKREEEKEMVQGGTSGDVISALSGWTRG